METIATHPGIVIASTSQEVQVKMEVLSACASCQAHSHCGFAEKKDKIVNIATHDWQNYHPGDTVNVIINSGRGIQAAIIAYLIPAILLLATLITLLSLHVPETLTILFTLLVVALYGVILYLFRSRLQNKFTFRIEKA